MHDQAENRYAGGSVVYLKLIAECLLTNLIYTSTRALMNSLWCIVSQLFVHVDWYENSYMYVLVNCMHECGSSRSLQSQLYIIIDVV